MFCFFFHAKPHKAIHLLIGKWADQFDAFVWIIFNFFVNVEISTMPCVRTSFISEKLQKQANSLDQFNSLTLIKIKIKTQRFRTKQFFLHLLHHKNNMSQMNYNFATIYLSFNSMHSKRKVKTFSEDLIKNIALAKRE